MTTSDGPTTSTTHPARPGTDHLPSFALPTVAYVAGSVAAPAVVGAAVAGIAALFNTGWTAPAIYGAVAAAVGALAGALVIRPWRVRSITRWPITMFVGQGAALAAVTLASVLLYSAAQPGTPVVFGLVAVAGFVLAMFAQVAVFTRRMRRSAT